MKIFILTDLEGASGVYTFAQTRDTQYPSRTRLVTKEEKVNDISDRLNILLF